MVKDKKTFGTGDIGAELLPILTAGLYRDPLDTLREYVQNAIDAKAKHVDIAITSDLVSILDNGTGMTREIANRAIRLGMSEKNPLNDVGFRGIGIYSAYNTCDKLEIITKCENEPSAKLVFNFKAIREQLKDEEERRESGTPSILSLADLLTNAVWVEDTDEWMKDHSGTLVIISGLRGDVLDRFLNYESVSRYLESVVPLPFDPSFSHKATIEKWFDSESFALISLNLKINNRKAALYQTAYPYYRKAAKLSS